MGYDYIILVRIDRMRVKTTEVTVCGTLKLLRKARRSLRMCPVVGVESETFGK